MRSLTERFHTAMIGVYQGAKDSGYNATYFKRMVDEHGGLAAAKRLLATRDIQTGLMKLWEMGCVHLSMEALVIQKQFEPLFTEDEIAEARRRLAELGYHGSPQAPEPR